MPRPANVPSVPTTPVPGWLYIDIALGHVPVLPIRLSAWGMRSVFLEIQCDGGRPELRARQTSTCPASRMLAGSGPSRELS